MEVMEQFSNDIGMQSSNVNSYSISFKFVKNVVDICKRYSIESDFEDTTPRMVPFVQYLLLNILFENV